MLGFGELPPFGDPPVKARWQIQELGIPKFPKIPQSGTSSRRPAERLPGAGGAGRVRGAFRQSERGGFSGWGWGVVGGWGGGLIGAGGWLGGGVGEGGNSKSRR